MSNNNTPPANPPYRKRKLYKFSVFKRLDNCFELEDWQSDWLPDILEIGAGRADLSLAMANQHPEQKILAIDVKADRLQAGASLAQQQKLTNLRFLRANINQLADILPTNSVETIWVTFPDPFPKAKQAKHRLVATNYLKIYQQLLKPTGKLLFKTDSLALFEFGLEELVNNYWYFHQLSFDLHGSNLSESYKVTTAYERRYLAENKPIYFVEVSLQN